jgi:plasmid stabilization system protein ParE
MADIRRFHPLVADDLAAAVGYYNELSTDLGNQFRDAVRDRLESISEFPESYGCIHEQIRAAMTLRFPYVILFEHRENTVAILGVFHAASDHAGWFDRAV